MLKLYLMVKIYWTVINLDICSHNITLQETLKLLEKKHIHITVENCIKLS